VITAARIAMWTIWGAYVLLALAITIFSFTIHERADIGTVWGATVLLGVAGTAACVALLAGSALGIYALVAQPSCRRPACVLTMVTGLIGGLFLGWIAVGFWGLNR
jgi:hypothetical protein